MIASCHSTDGAQTVINTLKNMNRATPIFITIATIRKFAHTFTTEYENLSAEYSGRQNISIGEYIDDLEQIKFLRNNLSRLIFNRETESPILIGDDPAFFRSSDTDEKKSPIFLQISKNKTTTPPKTRIG